MRADQGLAAVRGDRQLGCAELDRSRQLPVRVRLRPGRLAGFIEGVAS